MSAGEIGQAGLGGGVSSAAKTLSDYYIKRAEQYHPVIPIGAGNEVTLVFQMASSLKRWKKPARKPLHAGNKINHQPHLRLLPCPATRRTCLNTCRTSGWGTPSTRLQARLSRSKREPEYRPEQHNPEQSVP